MSRFAGPYYTSFPVTPGSPFTELGRAVDVLGPGTVELIDAEGRTVTYEFAAFDPEAGGAHSTFPYRIEIGYRAVGAGTDADCVYLH